MRFLSNKIAYAIVAAGLCVSTTHAEVFINEIHYDDATSTGDVGESIEVVATAGEALSGYKIYLYNGSNGAMYDSDTLPTGTTTNCGNSVTIASLSYATNGIQNGDPDGIALVNNAGTVVQFLSYEGTFAAADGPAAGKVSIDIAVAESSNTGAGTSLQLTGNGTSYADFTWNASATQTFGACNQSQNFGEVIPPSAQPEIVSNIPLHGTGSFPANGDLEVTFSESITLARGAINLKCDSARLVLLSYPTTGSTINIDPKKALPNADQCTLTVSAAKITDADGEHPAKDLKITFATAESAANYYSHVNESSAEQLRCSLHNTIKDHTAYPYSSYTGGMDTWQVLEIADEDPNDAYYILDVYRNYSYKKEDDRDDGQTSTELRYNREHTWPNSLGFKDALFTFPDGTTVPNPPYTDVQMLYLADKDYNKERGNKPYADCSGCEELITEYNDGYGGSANESNWVKDPDGNTGSYQTWNHRKGDVARAVLYMAIRYEGGANSTGITEPDLELTDDRSKIVKTSSSPAYMGLLSTLIAWHNADAPDDAERARNEIVYNFQGNRNPFIDHPEWATTTLFTSSKPANCTMQ